MILNDLINFNEYEILSKICAYYEAQRTYFQAGVDVIIKALPELQHLSEKVINSSSVPNYSIETI